jgi:hypothetical protein
MAEDSISGGGGGRPGLWGYWVRLKSEDGRYPFWAQAGRAERPKETARRFKRTQYPAGVALDRPRPSGYAAAR